MAPNEKDKTVRYQLDEPVPTDPAVPVAQLPVDGDDTRVNAVGRAAGEREGRRAQSPGSRPGPLPAEFLPTPRMPGLPTEVGPTPRVVGKFDEAEPTRIDGLRSQHDEETAISDDPTTRPDVPRVDGPTTIAPARAGRPPPRAGPVADLDDIPTGKPKPSASLTEGPPGGLAAGPVPLREEAAKPTREIPSSRAHAVRSARMRAKPGWQKRLARLVELLRANPKLVAAGVIALVALIFGLQLAGWIRASKVSGEMSPIVTRSNETKKISWYQSLFGL